MRRIVASRAGSVLTIAAKPHIKLALLATRLLGPGQNQEAPKGVCVKEPAHFRHDPRVAMNSSGRRYRASAVRRVGAASHCFLENRFVTRGTGVDEILFDPLSVPSTVAVASLDISVQCKHCMLKRILVVELDDVAGFARRQEIRLPAAVVAHDGQARAIASRNTRPKPSCWLVETNASDTLERSVLFRFGDLPGQLHPVLRT